jgi:hypothetical protein
VPKGILLENIKKLLYNQVIIKTKGKWEMKDQASEKNEDVTFCNKKKMKVRNCLILSGYMVLQKVTS